MAKNSLLCPFLDENPAFAHGVEFGMLWEKMKEPGALVADYFLVDNQEQITLAANRMGWTIHRMEQRVEAPGWVWVEMENGA